jgi:hypothetical protein
MGVWYAHRLNTTFIMSEMPPGWPKKPEDAPFFPDGWLNEKGWPTFERHVTHLIKNATPTSWRRIVDMAVPKGDSAYAVEKREVPAHPRTFAARLAQTMFTNGRSECEGVAEIYANTLLGTIGQITHLQFTSCGWSDDEIEELAKILPMAQRCTSLDLSGNRFGSRGFGALTEVIIQTGMPRLAEITVDLRFDYLFTEGMTDWAARVNERLGTELRQEHDPQLRESITAFKTACKEGSVRVIDSGLG